MAALPKTSPPSAPASATIVQLTHGLLRGVDARTMGQLARIAASAHVPAPRLMADYAALSLGPGRPNLSDYERLRLYDDAFWRSADRREVAGARRGHEIAMQANVRRDAFALATDRLAASTYLAAHGLPTAPLLAIYRAGLASPGRNLLRTRDELREFLQAHSDRPLVAQPAEGGRPRLLFSGRGAEAAADIDRLVGETADMPGVSWMLQPLVAPHPSYAPLTGGRPATVQLITTAAADEAQLLRALWRLGGGDDLVASLDLRTGRALRLFAAARPHITEPAPSGLAVPDWSALKAVACEGARLFSQFGLLGWEIAPGADGPVVLGLDPTPDLELPQLADRRGVLDAPFLAFLAERRSFAGG